jgi:hypothetical protein
MAQPKKGFKQLDTLFTGQSPSAVPSTRWGKQFWLDLVLVRPWILVGGFWLMLVLTIAIAFSGLTDPGKQRTAAPPPDDSQDPLVMAAANPDAAAASRLPADPNVSFQNADPAATLPGNSELPIPAWSLLAMVVACAGGCLIMSRPAILASQKRRVRGRPRTGKLAAVALNQPKPAKASPPKRLKPQYPSAQVMAVQPSGAIHRVAAKSGGAQPGASPKSTAKPKNKSRKQPAKPKSDPSATRQSGPPKPVSFEMSPSVITVLPAETSHPLDWPEESLAHSLDVRRKRSFKSFL